MKNKMKLFAVVLSLGVMVVTPSGELIKTSNIASARYDGWSSSNRVEATQYITNHQLKTASTDYLNILLTSAIGYLVPGGRIIGGFFGAGMGVVFTNSYYQAQRITAISQGKGLLVRLRFSYKTDNWGNRVPYLTNYYYSVM